MQRMVAALPMRVWRSSRHFLLGAWQLPKALAFLARRPRLWPGAMLPALAAAVLMAVGFGLGLLSGPFLEATAFEGSGPTPAWSGFVVSLGVRAVALVAGVLAGLGLALILAAPLLERLSRDVEAAARGQVLNRESGLRFEVAQSIRTAGYFLLRTPGIVLVGFVPFVGPALSAVWAAHALAFQNTEPVLGRRGLEFATRRAWHRRHRAESLGLGFASLVCLLVPCAGLLLAPAMVTAGTLLVLELDDAAATGVTRPSTG
jgi:uncharacterized protein involved in cysteine biosynthesis